MIHARGDHLLEIKMYTRVCYVVQVCQSLEAGRWLEEEKFEMTDCFPAAQVFTPLISVCFIMGCVHSVTSKVGEGGTAPPPPPPPPFSPCSHSTG